MTNPLVSVIIPAYMQEAYIQETINSVLDQTFQDFEIIVVDDGSTDLTGEKVKEYNDPRIKYHFQKNSGRPACSRNKGILLSRGKYIAFVDGDDIWLPHKLERQLEYFDKNKEFGFVFTNIIKFNGNKDLGVFIKRGLKSGRIFNDLFMRSCVYPSTVMTTRKCLDDVGMFDENPELRAIEDYDLWLRISYRCPVGFIKEPMAKYRIWEKNLCGTELAQLFREKRYTKIMANKMPIPRVLMARKYVKLYFKILLSIVTLSFKSGFK